MNARITIAAFALCSGLASVASADITGKAVLEGKAPTPKKIDMSASPDCVKLHPNPVFDETFVVGDNGELQNVAVYIKDGGKLDAAVPKTPVVLDQKGCMYVPHVVIVMVGQQLQARNSDGFMHNVHGLARANGEFNFPQQQKDQVNPIDATKAPETYKIKCDAHGWMSAWVVVTDSPYAAVTNDKGEFKIDTRGLKDGKYTLVAWHEKGGTQLTPIEVKNGAATADFKFSAKKKPAAPTK